MKDKETSLLKFESDPIRENIQDDEEIIWQGKPRMSTFVIADILKILPVALLFAAFDAFMLSGIIIGYEKSGQKVPIYVVIILVVFFAFHLFPLWIWLAKVVTAGRKYKNTEYCITNKKVIIQFGLIKKEVDIISFEKITTIYTRINFFEKLLDIGDLYMYVAQDNRAYSLNDIAQPRTVEDKLKEIVSDYKTQFTNTSGADEEKEDYDEYKFSYQDDDFSKNIASNTDVDFGEDDNSEEDTSNLEF